MLTYIRHGETNLNGPAGSSEERLRGWLPAGLTPKGVRQAKHVGENLKGLQPDSFHTSDLPRAVQTADLVGHAVHMKAKPTFNLRDWNTGHLAGQKFTDVKDELFHYIDHPDDTVKGGEPLRAYLDRFIPFVSKLTQDLGNHLVVGHARGTQVIHALAASNGQWLNEKPLKEKPLVDPGHVMIVSPDWSVTPDQGKISHSDKE